jgi:bacterioferritin-associated ferredoxin
MVLEYHSWNSQFLRLTHLMGFENGLCALYEEPEACYDLMSAITDHKIRIIERAHDYFHPDCFVNYDDVATERNLFMSRETYQKLIKPHHKRMNDAAKAYGMIPEQHCCGYCQDLMEDFIEEGAVAWQAAQPSNDIEWIIETYGDKLSVLGGYDTQGIPGQPIATDEQILEEVTRCMKTYGKYGKSYGFFGMILGNTDDTEAVRKTGLMISEVIKQGHEILKK